MENRFWIHPVCLLCIGGFNHISHRAFFNHPKKNGWVFRATCLWAAAQRRGPRRWQRRRQRRGGRDSRHQFCPQQLSLTHSCQTLDSLEPNRFPSFLTSSLSYYERLRHRSLIPAFIFLPYLLLFQNPSHNGQPEWPTIFRRKETEINPKTHTPTEEKREKERTRGRSRIKKNSRSPRYRTKRRCRSCPDFANFLTRHSALPKSKPKVSYSITCYLPLCLSHLEIKLKSCMVL